MGFATRLIRKRKNAAPITTVKEFPEVTPSAMTLMENQNIDPALVTGTGANGRIIKKDVVQFIEQRAASTEEE